MIRRLYSSIKTISKLKKLNSRNSINLNEKFKVGLKSGKPKTESNGIKAGIKAGNNGSKSMELKAGNPITEKALNTRAKFQDFTLKPKTSSLKMDKLEKKFNKSSTKGTFSGKKSRKVVSKKKSKKSPKASSNQLSRDQVKKILNDISEFNVSQVASIQSMEGPAEKDLAAIEVLRKNTVPFSRFSTRAILDRIPKYHPSVQLSILQMFYLPSLDSGLVQQQQAQEGSSDNQTIDTSENQTIDESSDGLDSQAAFLPNPLKTSVKLDEVNMRRLLFVIVSLFRFYPKESISLMKAYIDNLVELKCTLPGSVVCQVFQSNLFAQGSNDDVLELLKTLKHLQPLLVNTDSNLRDYFIKWNYLIVLNELENQLNEPLQSECIGKAITLKKDSNGSAVYTFTIAGNRKLKPSTLIKLKNGDFTFMGILKASGNTSVKSIEIQGADHFDAQRPWDLYTSGTFAPTKSEMEALLYVYNTNKKIGPIYDIIVNNDTSKAESGPKSSSSHRRHHGFEALNHSQFTALKSVVGKPISLIQGPPGTGKTHTLSNLVFYLRKYEHARVLVVTPTNSAADNVIDYCVKRGLKPIRLGEADKVNPEMLPYHINSFFPDGFSPDRDFLTALRISKNADVLVTTASSSSATILSRINIDYTIVDEASQLTEPLGLVPITTGTRHVVLVGDHKQLPPSVNYQASLEGYSESLFARLAKMIKPSILDTQYRSHPLIMSISSKLFYNNELKHGRLVSEIPPIPGVKWNENKDGEYLPVAFINSDHFESNNDGRSKVNESEGKIVVNLVKKLISKNHLHPKDIGVISPYSGQNRFLRNRLESDGINVEINSVDAYQGREKELIVFSATRANTRASIGFLKDPRRFNVMHTRAKRGLIIVGNRKTLSCDETWKKWFEWVDEHGLTVKSVKKFIV